MWPAARPRSAAGSGPLEQSRQLGEHAGRIAAGRRGLAGRQPDLAQRQAEAGDAVHQQQHRLALVTEMLGHRHGGIGGLAPHQWRRVRGGDDHDGTGKPVRPSSSSMNSRTSRPRSPTSASTATSQAVLAGEHRKQGRFTDSRAGEQAEPLPLPAGREAVQHADARDRAVARGAPGCRGSGRRRADRAWLAAWREAPRPSTGCPSGSMTRPSQDRRPQSRPAGPRPAGPALPACAARPEPRQRAERHGLRASGAKADHFGRDGLPSLVSELIRSPTATWPDRPAMSADNPVRPRRCPPSTGRQPPELRTCRGTTCSQARLYLLHSDIH